MDGRECLRQIKSDKYLRSIPIIMHSTALLNYDKDTFEKMDAKFLTKASTLESQLKSLNDVLNVYRRDA